MKKRLLTLLFFFYFFFGEKGFILLCSIRLRSDFPNSEAYFLYTSIASSTYLALYVGYIVFFYRHVDVYGVVLDYNWILIVIILNNYFIELKNSTTICARKHSVALVYV